MPKSRFNPLRRKAVRHDPIHTAAVDDKDNHHHHHHHHAKTPRQATHAVATDAISRAVQEAASHALLTPGAVSVDRDPSGKHASTSLATKPTSPPALLASIAKLPLPLPNPPATPTSTSTSSPTLSQADILWTLACLSRLVDQAATSAPAARAVKQLLEPRNALLPRLLHALAADHAPSRAAPPSSSSSSPAPTAPDGRFYPRVGEDGYMAVKQEASGAVRNLCLVPLPTTKQQQQQPDDATSAAAADATTGKFLANGALKVVVDEAYATAVRLGLLSPSHPDKRPVHATAPGATAAAAAATTAAAPLAASGTAADEEENVAWEKMNRKQRRQYNKAKAMASQTAAAAAAPQQQASQPTETRGAPTNNDDVAMQVEAPPTSATADAQQEGGGGDDDEAGLPLRPLRATNTETSAEVKAQGCGHLANLLCTATRLVECVASTDSLERALAAPCRFSPPGERAARGSPRPPRWRLRDALLDVCRACLDVATVALDAPRRRRRDDASTTAGSQAAAAAAPAVAGDDPLRADVRGADLVELGVESARLLLVLCEANVAACARLVGLPAREVHRSLLELGLAPASVTRASTGGELATTTTTPSGKRRGQRGHGDADEAVREAGGGGGGGGGGGSRAERRRQERQLKRKVAVLGDDGNGGGGGAGENGSTATAGGGRGDADEDDGEEWEELDPQRARAKGASTLDSLAFSVAGTLGKPPRATTERDANATATATAAETAEGEEEEAVASLRLGVLSLGVLRNVVAALPTEVRRRAGIEVNVARAEAGMDSGDMDAGAVGDADTTRMTLDKFEAVVGVEVLVGVVRRYGRARTVRELVSLAVADTTASSSKTGGTGARSSNVEPLRNDDGDEDMHNDDGGQRGPMARTDRRRSSTGGSEESTPSTPKARRAEQRLESLQLSLEILAELVAGLGGFEDGFEDERDDGDGPEEDEEEMDADRGETDDGMDEDVIETVPENQGGTRERKGQDGRTAMMDQDGVVAMAASTAPPSAQSFSASTLARLVVDDQGGRAATLPLALLSLAQLDVELPASSTAQSLFPASTDVTDRSGASSGMGGVAAAAAATTTASMLRTLALRSLSALSNLLLSLAASAPPPPSSGAYDARGEYVGSSGEGEERVARVKSFLGWLSPSLAPSTNARRADGEAGSIDRGGVGAAEELAATWAGCFELASRLAEVPSLADHRGHDDGGDGHGEREAEAEDGRAMLDLCLGCLWALARCFEAQSAGVTRLLALEPNHFGKPNVPPSSSSPRSSLETVLAAAESAASGPGVVEALMAACRASAPRGVGGGASAAVVDAATTTSRLAEPDGVRVKCVGTLACVARMRHVEETTNARVGDFLVEALEALPTATMGAAVQTTTTKKKHGGSSARSGDAAAAAAAAAATAAAAAAEKAAADAFDGGGSTTTPTRSRRLGFRSATTAETMVACLDALFDTYADETSRYDGVGFRDADLLPRLRALSVAVRSAAKAVDRRTHAALRVASDEAWRNLLAFVEYRTRVEKQLATS